MNTENPYTPPSREMPTVPSNKRLFSHPMESSLVCLMVIGVLIVIHLPAGDGRLLVEDLVVYTAVVSVAPIVIWALHTRLVSTIPTVARRVLIVSLAVVVPGICFLAWEVLRVVSDCLLKCPK